MFLRQTKYGVWTVVVTEPGNRSEISTGTKDRTEAEVFLARMNRGLTLGQLAKKYIVYSRTNHKPTTTQRARHALETFQKVIGSHIAVSDITPALIETFKEKRLKNGKRKVRPTSVNADLRHLKMFFSWLERIEQLIPFNPVKRVKMLDVPQSEIPTFTVSMFEHWLPYVVAWARPFVQFAFATGMRRNEVIALKWEHIDRQRRIAYVKNTDSFNTKNNKNRAVPLNGMALAALPHQAGEYVFMHKGEMIDERRITEVVRWAVTAANLHPGLHLHSLRHSFCTILLENGASLSEVATIAGHSTVAVTEKYAHLKGETMHHAADLLTKPRPNGAATSTDTSHQRLVG